MDVKEALVKLREEKKRKFSQSVDLIINFKSVDLRRENVNTVVVIPHKAKDKKVCAFFDAKSDAIPTITKPEFAKFKDKNELKKLVKKYDFFIAAAPLMPSVATTFGKVLGPAGKMPSPQLGILPVVNDDSIKAVLEKIAKSVKIRAKEASIKVSVGNESMTDEQISANIIAVHKGIVAALPKKQDNVKNTLLKFTMTSPIKLEKVE